MAISNSRDTMRRFIFADELFQVGLIEEQAPADFDGPDLLCPVEPGKPAKAYPEQARRLPRREELHGFPPTGRVLPSGSGSVRKFGAQFYLQRFASRNKRERDTWKKYQGSSRTCSAKVFSRPGGLGAPLSRHLFLDPVFSFRK